MSFSNLAQQRDYDYQSVMINLPLDSRAWRTCVGVRFSTSLGHAQVCKCFMHFGATSEKLNSRTQFLVMIPSYQVQILSVIKNYDSLAWEILQIFAQIYARTF